MFYRTKVLINPFEDIQPRKTIEMLVDDEDEKKAKKRPKSKMKATKDYKLLSFGEEAEDEEDDLNSAQVSLSKKPKSSHDLLDDPKLLKEAGGLPAKNSSNEDELRIKGDFDDSGKNCEGDVNIESLRDKLKKGKNKSKIETKEDIEEDELILDNDIDFDDEATKQKKRKEEIRKEIKALKKEMLKSDEDKNKQDMDESAEMKTKLQKLSEEQKSNDLLVAYHAEQEKYKSKAKPNKKGSKREADTMDYLKKFKNQLFSAKHTDEKDAKDAKNAENAENSESDDENWMTNPLKFQSDDPIVAKDANTKDDDWFNIYDPRNPLNKRRRERDSKKKK